MKTPAAATEITDEVYRHTPAVWDANKCARLAKKTQKDGYGTPYHFKGFIGPFSGMDFYGTREYNGGIIREGKLYKAEHIPLPQVADGYEIVNVPYWGYRIKRIDEE